MYLEFEYFRLCSTRDNTTENTAEAKAVIYSIWTYYPIAFTNSEFTFHASKMGAYLNRTKIPIGYETKNLTKIKMEDLPF